MRQGIVIVDGKKVNLDKAEVLYINGRYRQSRGVTLFKTEKGNLLWLRWTNWQGEYDAYKFVTPEEAKELLEQQPHVARTSKAILDLGLEIPEA